MSANLGKCHLDLPSTDDPGEDVAGTGVDVCGEEGLRLELAFGVTHEKPTDRHWRHAAAMPESRAAGDLDETVGSAVPETDAVAPPNDFAILDESGQLLQGLTLDWRTTTAFALLRREREQSGVKAPAGGHTDMVADRGEEFDGGERAVGDQDDRAIGEPAVDLQGGLARPIKQGLGGPRLVGIKALRGSKQSE